MSLDSAQRNYYEVLKLPPAANQRTILKAYTKMVRDYERFIAGSSRKLSTFPATKELLDEAVSVLANPECRTAYDRSITEGISFEELDPRRLPKIEQPEDPDRFLRLLSKKKSKSNSLFRSIPLRAMCALLVVAVLVFISGSTIALASPEEDIAPPFKMVALAELQVSAYVLCLVDSVRTIMANAECRMISNSLQYMRIETKLKTLSPVSQPTNDMTRFPSPQNPLYPEFVDRPNSLFNYTVDKNGIVKVDNSGSLSDALSNIDKHILILSQS